MPLPRFGLPRRLARRVWRMPPPVAEQRPVYQAGTRLGRLCIAAALVLFWCWLVARLVGR